MKRRAQKNIKQNSRDQQIVVLEDINSKFSLVLEQFSGLNKKIDGNHQEFLEFRDEMVGFKDRTDKNLKIALEYLFRIDEEIQDLKMEIKDLKKLLKEKADLERLEIVEKRLLKLEKLVLAKLAQ